MASTARPVGFIGRNLYWLASLVAAAICAAAIIGFLGESARRVRYWVLADAVPARASITPDMLVERTALAGTIPDTWLDLSYVTAHQPLYARTSLPSESVLLPGNVSPQARVGAEVPPGYVTASFSAEPQNAVAGRLTAGDYVDVGALVDTAAPGIQNSKTATIVLHRVLILDVTDAPITLRGNADGIDGPDPAAAEDSADEGGVAGAASLYTVAVTYADWAKLMLLQESTIFLALSPEKAPKTLKDPVTATTADAFTGKPLGDSSAELPPYDEPTTP